MIDYTEQQDFVDPLLLQRAEYERLCSAAEALAEAIDRLAAAITEQANVRITDS